MFKKIVSVLTLLFITFSISACSKSETTETVADTRQILHMGNGDEVQTLDPGIATGVPESHVFDALFEGLVILDPKTLKELPGVAASWALSDDRLTYTFNIRKDAKWSNGDSVTAHDFVFSWRRNLTPTLGSEYAYMLYPIKNAKAFSEGKVTDPKELGVKATDDYTLVVNLESVTPFFLTVLTHQSMFPVNQKAIEKHGKFDDRENKWARVGNLVSNGPFQLKEWKLNDKLILDRNVNYWDQKNVKLDEVHYYPINIRQTEERKFRAGELHITDEIPPNKINVYKKKNPDMLHLAPWLGSYYYTVNVTKPPFNDKRVRKALAMSINRETIVKNVTKGGELPYGAFTPPNTRGYTPDMQIPYNIEEAKKLLAEAGFPDGKGFPKVSLLYNTDEMHRNVAEAIQQMWKVNLGIDIELSNQDWKVYLDSLTNLDYEVVRRGWIGDYNDPSTFLDMFLSYSGNNKTGWKNAEYDKLVTGAAKAKTDKERLALFRKAEKILLDEAPLLPIYVYTRVYLKSPKLKGWHANILDRHIYKSIYLD